MAQIFHPSTNTFSKVSIFGAVFFIGGLLWAFGALERSSYMTGANVVLEQPVPFSHRHHVSQLGIDCRYCHTSVEESSFAGIPSTKTCMTCHSQIHNTAEMLEPVRASWRENKSIEWVRVNDLPDFAYFNHSIHVKKGVGCVTCHGPMGEMAITWRESPLTMEWCLQCHRGPEKFVRPRAEVFSTTWKPEGDQLVLGRQLVQEHKIQKLTNCSICHR